MCKLSALAFGRLSLALALACTPLHFTKPALCKKFHFLFALLHFFNAMHFTWHCCAVPCFEFLWCLKIATYPLSSSFWNVCVVLVILASFCIAQYSPPFIKPTWGMYRKYWLNWSLTNDSTWLKITYSWTIQGVLTLLKLSFHTLFVA